MIESYTFGKITINGKNFSKDVMILPDGKVISPWWRQRGHTLTSSDIKEIFKSKPEIVVVGTGSSGMMKPEPRVVSDLQAKGIQVEIEPTGQAVDLFNSLREKTKAVAACFHLTC